jgi:hypothetical protein
MSKFEAKKRLLVAESEAYRQLLKLEIQTLRLHGMRTKRRLLSFGTYLPLLMSGIPFVTGLFKRKRGGFGRLGSLAFLAWKAYRRFAPMFGRGKFSMAKEELEEKNAAEEFLAKRL